MCAITGVISSDPEPLRRIQEMTALLRHRGPDDEGYLLVCSSNTTCLGGQDTPSEAYHTNAPYKPVGNISEQTLPDDARLALGHRRLSILDLSPLGHQPMSYLGRYWIIYNGEVFNYLELRTELEAAGCRFVSHTDTEVILAAYHQWGVDCLSRFNGMWAFAIYDTQKDLLFLARDRFGVKPLYYWMQKGTFAFASEIKAFSALPGWRPRVNGQAVHDFLLLSLHDHSRETMFADVFQLEPGCCATLDCRQWRNQTGTNSSQGFQITRWYNIEPRAFHGSLAEAAEQFEKLLGDSVRLRLRSDVPVGSCLSGGLDSSSIVCLANRLLREKDARCAQKTFSACAEIKRFDERDYIEKVVAATGVESHYVFPSLEDLFKRMDALMWHQDEPFATTSIFAQWTVFELAAHHQVKVMLDGQGADELLFGYAEFRRAFLAGLLRSLKPGTAWREATAMRGNSSSAMSVFLRAMADACTPMAVQRSFRGFKRNQRPPAWLSPQRLGASFPGRLASRFRHHTTARELSLELMGGAHLQMLLHWEDRNSMAHSVESRVPFLDYRLVEFAMGLPDEYKIHDGWSKAVLRLGMRNIVPEPILQRTDKMGFVTPEQIWVTEEGSAQFRKALTEAVSVSQGILTPEAIGYFENIITGKVEYSSVVWRMICLGRWMQRFGVSI